MARYRCVLSLMLVFLALPAAAAPRLDTAKMPTPQLLWPSGAPGAKGDLDEDKPALWVFLPPESNAVGTAVVICPGGGYAHLAIGHEGKDVAEWLNSLGVAAFVLRYRLAPRYQHPAPLLDVQRAVRTVRAGADYWHIDPARIGVMGFSAGGHLASTIGTHFDPGDSAAKDPIDKVGCRPDFLILAYPVISLGSDYSHAGSKKNLLGDNPEAALIESLSNEKVVTPETPPTFLFHTNADTGVVPENSVLFYLALRKAKVPAEMHIFEHGRHGIGLAPGDPAASIWPTLCANWLRGRGVLPAQPAKTN
jgi:acetyl esterase/lipase